MSAIAILREIVTTKGARVLLFDATNTPIVEEFREFANLYADDAFDEEYEEHRLLVDIQTANVMVTVYDAVKPETQTKIDRLLVSKSGFVKVCKVAWGAVK